MIFFYPSIANRLGALVVYRTAMLLSIPFYAMLCLLPPLAGGSQSWLLWPALMPPYLVLQALANCCYTSCFQLIARSTSSEKLGAANGVGQSAAGLARMVGPVLGSLSVAWSLTNGLSSPFDYHFVFVILFPFMCWWPYALSKLLPPSIDPIYAKRQRERQRREQGGGEQAGDGGGRLVASAGARGTSAL